MFNNDNMLCYIRNNITGKMIYLPVTPSGVSESISANFTQQDIIGASRPRIVYASTGAKQMSMSLQNLTEDYLAEGFTSLISYIYALEALVYPNYNSGLVQSPSLTVVLGHRSMSCVCTNISVSWGDTVYNQGFKSCNVDLTLLMTRPNIPGATEVERDG